MVNIQTNALMEKKEKNYLQKPLQRLTSINIATILLAAYA